MAETPASLTKLPSLLSELQSVLEDVSHDAGAIETNHKELAVLQAEIESSKARLKGLSTAIDTHEKQLSGKSSDLDALIESKQDELADITERIARSQNTLKMLEASIKTTTKEDEQLRTFLVGRKEGQRLLEKQIADLEASTSAAAHQMQHQLDEKETAKAKLEEDIARLGDEWLKASAKLHEMQDQNAAIAETQHANLAQYRTELESVEADIANKKTALQAFSSQMKQREQEIEAREESIKIQQAGLVKQKHDLDAERRKFESDKAVF